MLIGDLREWFDVAEARAPVACLEISVDFYREEPDCGPDVCGISELFVNVVGCVVAGDSVIEMVFEHEIQLKEIIVDVVVQRIVEIDAAVV